MQGYPQKISAELLKQEQEKYHDDEPVRQKSKNGKTEVI